MSDLINWKELSRRLAGNETSITRNRIPKKYQHKVDSFIECVEGWEEKNIKTADLEQKPDEEADT
ncbi:MAG: hypothetical protein CMC76_12125 [Flavobacteriaceae bacterium]|nr:hypothetical protein [Flavobacteriaceae bacterium]|tara:strand:+ start:4612 stop:4806 length:195 start_codon:yes stop_codon:yes gene_type:complete